MTPFPQTMTYIVIPSRRVDAAITPAAVHAGTWTTPENVVGQGGENVLFAHARPSLFRHLATIGPEEPIYIITTTGTREYAPVARIRTTPENVDVLGGWDDQTILLVTCGGVRDEWRDIVVARRTDEQEGII